MKKLYFFNFSLIATFLVLTSCGNDEGDPNPVDCSENILSGVSFSASIQNIITTKCAISGCHVSGTGRQDFTQFSIVQSNASGIKSRTQSGSMPKTGSITQEQKDLITCWVDDGAPNN